MDQQVLAVLGEIATKGPLLLVRTLVDQLILALPVAQPVVVDLVKVVRSPEGLALLWLVEPAVAESLAIHRPVCPGEFAPADVVGLIVARRDLAHAPLLPIRSRRRQAVGEEFSILAHRVAGQRDRAVLGELVRVEQDLLRRARFVLTPVEHRLILQAGLARIDDAPAIAPRHADLVVIPDRLEALLDALAAGQFRQVSLRELRLRGDPRPGLSGVDLLEPAIRVSNFLAVEILDQIALARLRVVQFRHLRACVKTRQPGGRQNDC